MNDLRTAAQQALAFTMRDFASLRDFEAAKAVLHDNLRAALAQEQEPVAAVAENATAQQRVVETPPSDYRRGYWDGFNIGKREGRIEAEDALAQPPEPVQEPYCRVYEYDSVFGLHRELYPREYNGRKPDRAVPLYTDPPQRKPLTDEEITDAVREADLDWQAGWTLDEHEPNRFTTLARAIERKVRGE